MSLENDITATDTTLQKAETARKGIRRYIDDNTTPLITNGQLALVDYGDVCFALGFLASLAKEAAQYRDSKSNVLEGGNDVQIQEKGKTVHRGRGEQTRR